VNRDNYIFPRASLGERANADGALAIRIRIVADGRVLQGTPKQIVEAMRSIAFGQENRTLSKYIDSSVDMARRMTSVELRVEGDTDDERVASFVNAMIMAGLAAKLFELSQLSVGRLMAGESPLSSFPRWAFSRSEDARVETGSAKDLGLLSPGARKRRRTAMQDGSAYPSTSWARVRPASVQSLRSLGQKKPQNTVPSSRSSGRTSTISIGRGRLFPVRPGKNAS
jgi:hypothetical protein